MQFTHTKHYENNKIHEKYYIDGKEVEKHTYETLDNDAFEEHIKNIKPKVNKGCVDLKQPSLVSICNHLESPEEFHAEINGIVNHIKVSDVNNGACKIIEIINIVREQQYMAGYIDGITNVKDDLNSCIIKLAKNRYGGKPGVQR
jgi:hypothetical protein